MQNGRRRRPFSYGKPERPTGYALSDHAPYLLLIVVIAACAPAPSSLRPAGALAGSANISSEVLAAHNRDRAAVGVAPLIWDHALASAAAAFARQLAAHGALRHSPREARLGQGENLWTGSKGGFPPQAMVANWVSEKARFRPGTFPAVSRTGNWADVGHYSQMIWPTTTRLGCAIASSPRYDVLVCRYAPAGNVDGRRVP